MEILVLHPGALGDIILSLPAIELLRREYPAARITLAGNLDHLSGIVEGQAEAVVALSTLPLHRLYGAGSATQQDLKFWTSFDLIISWTGAGDPDFVRNLCRIHPHAIVAPWRPAKDETRHVSQIFADTLRPVLSGKAGLNPARIVLDPKWRGQAAEWIRQLNWGEDKGIVAVHPGASSLAKRWPQENFIRLMRHILDTRGKRVLLIQGPADPNLPHLDTHFPIDVATAASMPLPMAAALLVRCELFIGNDSGIAHLAAATGVRSLVIFGPTLPQHWRPSGDHVTVLRGDHNCNSCLSGTGVHTCISSISIDTVLRHLPASMLK